MIDKIKEASGKISEDYLLKKKDMNDAIYEYSKANRLNEEWIRRLCEFANQNTYLSLFQNKSKRGNIIFDLADSKKVIDKIKELDMADKDYLKTPEDYRVSDEYGQEIEHEEEPVKVEKSLEERLRELNKKIRLNDRLAALLSAIKSMKTQEEGNAEKSILKTSALCRSLTFNGESFGDMTKLALRYTQEKGYSIEKTAKLYQAIGSYLDEKGFKLNQELTKISSLKINPSSDMYKPLETFHQSLLKLSGLREMEKNLELLVKGSK